MFSRIADDLHFSEQGELHGYLVMEGAQVNSFELMFVELDAILKDEERQCRGSMAELHFIYDEIEHSVVHLIFEAITTELLVYLLSHHSQFPFIEVFSIKLIHV